MIVVLSTVLGLVFQLFGTYLFLTLSGLPPVNLKCPKLLVISALCPTQQNLKYAIVFNSITKSCHSKKGLDFPRKHEKCKKNNNSMILGYENVSKET